MNIPSPHTPALSRRSAFGLALGGLAAASAVPGLAHAAARTGGGRARFAAVDAIARQIVADGLTPGLTLSIMRDGALIHSAGFGFSNLETGTRVTPRSVFRIGSITKQFTAAAIMALAEEGRLSVDDVLSRHLPDFPRAGDVTLRQMMSHTSGLGNYTDTENPADFLKAARLDYEPKALLSAMAATKPLFKFEPGAGWAYSNTAYVLLGLVIEKVTGAPYEAYFARRLFRPAGLVETAVDHVADVVPNRASGYQRPDPTSKDYVNAAYISMTFPGAAGSMRSTPDDLCRWHAALFGGRVLNAGSLKLMTTPVRLKDGSLPTAAAGPKADSPRREITYGFGLGVDDKHGPARIGHGGGIFGFGSQLQTIPSARFTWSFIANVDGSASLGEAERKLDDAIAALAV